MAFMSITALADDLKDCAISVPNVTFGSASFSTAALAAEHDGIVIRFGGVALAEGVDYEIVEGYFLTEDATSPVMTTGAAPTTAHLKDLSVGDYYIKFTGLGGYATTSASKKFTVTGKLLANTMLSATLIADQPYTGSAIEPATTGRLTDGAKTLVLGTDYTAAYSNNINASDAAKITYTGMGDYSGSISETFTISPKTLLESWITKDVVTVTYNGGAQTPDYTIKDGDKTLVKGTDYTVTVAATNAGKYSPVIAGTGNYATTADITLTEKFVIAPAGLTIRALPQTKVYDANTNLPSEAEGVAYEVLGKIGADDIGLIELSKPTSANVTSTFQITPSTYKMIGDPDPVKTTWKNPNYDYNYVPATLTITPRGLKITAKDDSKTFGQEDTEGYAGVKLEPTLEKNAAGAEIAWGIPGGESDAMLAASVPAAGATPAVVNGDVKVVREGKGTVEDKGEYAGALTVTYTATAPVFANYTVETVAGKYTINGGKIYITALNQSKNYGEADPDWTAVEGKNFIVTGLSGTEKLVKLPTLTRTTAVGDPVGTYKITPSGAEAPAGYKDIVYTTATFTIKARPISIKANTQTLKTTDAVTALDNDDFEITNTKADEGLVSGDKATDVLTLEIAAGVLTEGLHLGAITKVNGAKAGNYNITYTPGDLIVIDPTSTIVLNRPASAAYTADPTKDNADAVIKAAAGTKFTKAQANSYNKAIAPDAAKQAGDVETPAVAPTYTETVDGTPQAGKTYYTYEAGGYTEFGGGDFVGGTTYYEMTAAGSPEVLYTDDTAYDYNATLGNANFVTTADQRAFGVTFSDFAMKAEKWYPVVLPFATSVKEVSETFGYAIVNILNKKNTNAKKIAFKLHMGDIAANEPFVVKVYEDINMNEVTFGAGANRKAIVYSEAPEVADESGVKFIGSYSHKKGFAANEAFFSVSAEKNDYYWGSATNTTYMAPLSAYFQIPEGTAARIIEFEEADGTKTAIQAVNAKAETMSAEGWYTIGGMKLQSAPTQKGIYIKDGKKFIVK